MKFSEMKQKIEELEQEKQALMKGVEKVDYR
jgi:hypothetical protein